MKQYEIKTIAILNPDNGHIRDLKPEQPMVTTNVEQLRETLTVLYSQQEGKPVDICLTYKEREN